MLNLKLRLGEIISIIFFFPFRIDICQTICWERGLQPSLSNPDGRELGSCSGRGEFGMGEPGMAVPPGSGLSLPAPGGAQGHPGPAGATQVLPGSPRSCQAHTGPARVSQDGQHGTGSAGNLGIHL